MADETRLAAGGLGVAVDGWRRPESEAKKRRRAARRREPMTVDPNKFDEPLPVSDVWYWQQVEAKR